MTKYSGWQLELYASLKYFTTFKSQQQTANI